MKVLTDLSIFQKQSAKLFRKEQYFALYGDEKPTKAKIHIIPAKYRGSCAVFCFYAASQIMNDQYFSRRINQNFYSIDFVVAGTAFYRCGDHGFCAEAGDLVLLHPGNNCDLFHPAEEPPCQTFGFLFEGTMLHELIMGLHLDNLFCMTVRNPPLFAAVCDELSSCVKNWQQPNGECLCAASSYKLLQMIAKDHAETVSSEPGALKIRRLLEEHAGETINMTQLARSLNLSVPTFNKMFKADYGVTPFQYLKKYRLARAARLLRNSSRQIKMIAEESGFPSPQHFILEFHKYFGSTPGEYRNRAMEEETAQSHQAQPTENPNG